MAAGWKAILGQVAPALATALGGPLAGMAVKELGAKWLGKPDAKESDIEAAVIAANPETLLKLRELDNAFKSKLVEAGVELERLTVEDRASARAREIALKDWTPKLVAFSILAIFASTHVFLLSQEAPAGSRELVARAMGTLDALTVAIVSYYFGSSSGSRAKTESLIDKATK